MLSFIQARLGRVARPVHPERYAARAQERLRFTTLFVIAAFKLFNFFGGNWDIQWHYSIGRDSLWIPPHLMVMVAFVAGSLLVMSAILQETRLARAGIRLEATVRLGPLQAPLAYFGVLAGYMGALLSAGFDELWHEIYGIDVTLWSPPHLCIMASTLLVDLSLLAGMASAARRLGWKFEPRNPFFWGLILAGAYTFESVNFQMGQAFIVAYQAGGKGVIGLLFPILVGMMFSLSLMLIIRLSGHFWSAALVFLAAICLQYAGTGIAAAGLAILKPASVVDSFVLLNPTSALAQTRQFITLAEFGGVVGFMQAFAMWLSALPLVLVSALEGWSWASRHPWIAAPVYSSSLVLVAYLWFQQNPLMSTYGNTWGDAALAALLSALGSLLFARAGLWLAQVALKSW